MQKETQDKLNVLLQAKKINQSDLAFLNQLDRDLSKFDNGNKEEMLLIHVAMSLSRQRAKGTVDPMPNELWKQVASKPMYKKATKYWENMRLKAPLLLNSNESQYIVMHLVNVLSKRGNG